ncbi:MAG: glycerol-3-phosphate acyltransferase [Ruminococcus sp.]|nr:glycerol-3-phosphate acyltransferase [Ruminococcus sp.]
MQIIMSLVIGYLIGGINPAYIISRIRGFDIRDRGSGNAGASNVVITMGKKAGAFTALFDISKGAAAALIAAALFPQLRAAKIISGSACILGHIFPALMHFHGGKGLASLAGVIMAYDMRFFVILLTIEAVIGLWIDYVCVVPMSGSVIFTVFYALTSGDPVGTLCLAVAAVVMQFRHIENLKRIQNGTEAHISFLWRKDKELDRIKKNTST